MNKAIIRLIALFSVTLSMVLVTNFVPFSTVANTNILNSGTADFVPTSQTLNSWSIGGSGSGLPTAVYGDNYFVYDCYCDTSPTYYYAYYSGNNFTILNGQAITGATLNLYWYSYGSPFSVDISVNGQWKNVVSNYSPGSASDHGWKTNSYSLSINGWTVQTISGFEVRILKSTATTNTAGVDYIGLTVQYGSSTNTGSSSNQIFGNLINPVSNNGFALFILLGVIILFITLGVTIFVVTNRRKSYYNNQNSSPNNISHVQTFNDQKPNYYNKSNQNLQTQSLQLNSSTVQQPIGNLNPPLMKSPIKKQSSMFCSKCGSQLELEDLFCFNCGENQNK